MSNQQGAIIVPIDKTSYHLTPIYSIKRLTEVKRDIKNSLIEKFDHDGQVTVKATFGERWGPNSFFITGELGDLQNELYTYLCSLFPPTILSRRPPHIDTKGVDFPNNL